MKNRRKYLSLYFSNGHSYGRKRRDVTIAMDPKGNLYKYCANMTSSDIKKLLGIESYRDLAKKARMADRTIGGYVKHLLKQKVKSNE